ncbi:hypothetical protein BGZ50_005300 [Haplosporangium sp. Z 11]|nr:hypothetical protein BGZ50_005300 [Haplosporangium sp. Z 11]
MSDRPQRHQRPATSQEYTSRMPSSYSNLSNLGQTPSRSGPPSGPSARSRAESMPIRNKEIPDLFTDDLLRKISSKIAEKPTGRSHDTHNDENSHLRAPLNSRVAARSYTDVDHDSRLDELRRPGMMSLKMQENAIIEDILFTMMGIEGKYISIVQPTATADQGAEYIYKEFKIDDSFDPSLRDLVSRILPLASTYLSLEAFVALHSKFEYGFEYLILIAQLETQFRSSPDFTLQKLWYYIQPTMQTLRSLDVLIGVLREAGRREEPEEDDIEALLNPQEGIPLECKGGSILGYIATGMFNMSGDPATKKLYGFLLNKASVPYIAMLESWIHKGHIRDPYEEFMIVRSTKVSKENIKDDFNDAYWEQRYTIRENHVPSFLVPLKSKILHAGKYLNAIRECGIHLSTSKADQDTSIKRNSTYNVEQNDVLAVLSGGKLVDMIESAYHYANKRLLDLLFNENQLLERLRSMKRYFFLDQSDYFTHFLDLASVELKQPLEDVSLTKLQSLMDLVLRNPSTVTNSDIYKEDLRVGMSNTALVDQLLRIINVSGAAAQEAEHGRLSVTRTRSRASSSGTLHQRGASETWRDEIAGNMGMSEVIAPDGAIKTKSPSEYASAMEGIMSASTELPAQNTQNKSLLGIDALTLDYSVKFPLSLVISRKALTKYQLIFRHLLSLKHGEQVLCHAWIEHSKSPIWKNVSPELKQWRGRVYSLRTRMLAFVQQFAYYVCSEVLEPKWRDLASKLATVATVDQVLQIHSDFLDTCLNECMLTNSKLLRIYSKLMSMCIKFSNYTDRFTRALAAMENQLNDETAAIAPASQVQQIEQAMRRLNEYEDLFVYHLKLLIEALNFYSATETVQFLCLVVRLDYNQFYANQNSSDAFGPVADPQST